MSSRPTKMHLARYAKYEHYDYDKNLYIEGYSFEDDPDTEGTMWGKYVNTRKKPKNRIQITTDKEAVTCKHCNTILTRVILKEV